MVNTRSPVSRRATVFALLVSATALVLAGLGQSPAGATHQAVTEVEGSAYGCYANTSFGFGAPGAPTTVGPLPTVTLPSGGGSEAAAAESCEVFAFGEFGGPAVFTSGPLTVTTEGTTGPTGSVTSTADVDTVNTSGIEAFTAGNVSSTCTADQAGVTGSTTITGGTVETASGPVAVPENPEPNTVIPVNIGFASYNYIFNEQIIDPDTGSITVNALRMETLTGPLQGTVIAGQVVCDVTADGPTDKDQCKNGGWETFGYRNQGQCVSSVVSHHGPAARLE